VSAIFPEAVFLHVVRDGRAVAHSLMLQDWWLGRQGPEHWRWGPLTPEDHDLWTQSGQSLTVLAGLQWKLLMANIAEQSASLGRRYCEVRYEDLVRDPDSVMTQILDWAELPVSPAFSREVRSVPFRDANTAWRREMDAAEQDKLNRFLGPALARFGYECT
jgi:hypothetical protein